MSKKTLIVLTAAVLMAGLINLSGCGEKKSEEKMAEKIIKQTTGKDVTVKMKGGKIEIEGEDSKHEIAETSEWPADMFKDVPPFTFGKIERVHKGDETGMKKFNIYLKNLEGDAVDKYADVLRKNGWQASVSQMGDKAGMLNAQKGNLAINFPFSLQEKNGALIVYNVPNS